MTCRLFVIGIGSLVLAAYPATANAQSYGSRAAWSSVMHDVLGLDVTDLTPHAVGQALCALGANITGDVDYGPGQFRRIDTAGEAGYGLPGLQVVNYAFSDGRLTSVNIRRQLAAAGFEQRVRDLSARLPLEKRDATFAFFRGRDMQVSLSLISEFYQGLIVSREALSAARSPKITCSASSPPSPAPPKNAPLRTMDDAARAGLVEAWALQYRDAREWGGTIYRDKDGFSYARTICPELCTFSRCEICSPEGVEMVGSYHTHPNTGELDNSTFRQYFTLTDVRSAVISRIPMYMRSELGIRKLDPEGLTLSWPEWYFPTSIYEPVYKNKGVMIPLEAK